MNARSHRKWIWLAVAVCSIALVGLLAGCGKPSQSSDSKTEGTTTSTEIVKDSGLFPDTVINTEYLNQGNRGCNSCHPDISALVEKQRNSEGYTHPTSPPGYGIKPQVTYCLGCHRLHMEAVGPSLGDLLHGAHYNSTKFVKEQNGNCWSCHAMTANDPMAATGDPSQAVQPAKWVLWDEYKYTAAASGYPGANGDMVMWWVGSRGFTGSNLMSVSRDSDMNVKVNLTQEVSDEKDQFYVNNWNQGKIDEKQYKITLKGVVNERSFTLDELKAMPATERTVTNSCIVNTPGGPAIANFPVKGVKLSYLIDQCGGLKPGVNTVIPTAYVVTDNPAQAWSWPGGLDEYLIGDAMIAYEYYGHPLTVNQGFPCTLVVPGTGGAKWVKYPETIEFKAADKAPADDHTVFPHPVVSLWLDPANDGKQLKVGETVTLKGVSYAWAVPNNRLAKISFSFDYGKTWKTYDVPENFDPYQWTNWSVEWTPPAAGTYVFKVTAEDIAGYKQATDASVIVVVK